MKISLEAIEIILEQLAETPKRFLAASNAIPLEQLQNRPEPETWSVNKILAHLRACVDVWGEQIEAMLTQDKPVLRYLSPHTWIRKTDYPEQEFQSSLQIFIAQRQALLNTLTNLSFDDWQRDALIKERNHTVFSHTQRMALHEQGHCEQLDALLQEL